MKNVLIFEAHSDDCVIGIGGTTQKFHEDGYRNILVTFTKGETAYSTVEMKGKMTSLRKEEGAAADKWIKIDEHINWPYGCQAVENTREVFQDCVELIRKYKPEYIFTHSPEDKHRDHKAISAIVTEAWWKATEGVLADRGEPYRAEKLYYFEVTELFTHPMVVIDISPYYQNKIKAMHEFKSQFEVMQGLVSYVEGMAKVRGLFVDGDYGEAFVQSDFIPTSHF